MLSLDSESGLLMKERHPTGTKCLGLGVPLTLLSSPHLLPTSLLLIVLASLGPKGLICSCYTAFISVAPSALRTLPSDLRMLPFPHHFEFISNVISLGRPSWATFPFLFSLPTIPSHIT